MAAADRKSTYTAAEVAALKDRMISDSAILHAISFDAYGHNSQPAAKGDFVQNRLFTIV